MVEKTTLPNGVQVVTEHIPHVRSVSLGFWLNTGSRHERKGQHGVSHFIEHLVFKGTETRSARDIAETIDGVGGQLNAFTTKELTCYHARVLERWVDLAIELMADMVLRPKMAEEDIEKEKGVILEEIAMYEDTPEEVAHELFVEGFFHPHPLARSVLGSRESVRRLSRTDVLAYLKERYTAKGLVVAAAGHVDHERVVRAAERYLGGMASEGAGVRPQSIPQSRPRVYWREKDIEQVHLCLGGRGLPRGDERRFALLVLDTALGGGMSSRLFQSLREERGLVYTVYSFHNAFREAGVFGIYAATGPDRAREVVASIEAELERVLQDGFTEGELQRAKEQLKGSIVFGLESTSTRMGRLAKCQLFDEPLLTYDELMERIDAVSHEDVAGVAQSVLDSSRFTCVGVGPWVDGAFAPLGQGYAEMERVS